VRRKYQSVVEQPPGANSNSAPEIDQWLTLVDQPPVNATAPPSGWGRLDDGWLILRKYLANILYYFIFLSPYPIAPKKDDYAKRQCAEQPRVL
jgi:hypothetical protein